MVQALFEQLLTRLEQGESLMLCVVVATRGSTPQERGAKMLVLGDGKTIGTLGGGCVEAEVRQQALKLLERSQSDALEFKLDHDYGWDDGLICGGVMQIAARHLTSADAEDFRKIVTALRAKQGTEFIFEYRVGNEAKRYVEQLGPPPVLVIAGGGHVGQALASIAAAAEFDVHVIDDRADIISPERFPTAKGRIVGEIEDELRRFPITPDTYVTIVTRGHRHDGRALEAVIDSPAKYLGLIGSKAKIKLIFDDLAAKGVDPEKLKQVHAPIGLDIGAVTVPEIAVSIAAELIAIKRGCGGSTKEMKLNSNEIEARLKRAKSL